MGVKSERRHSLMRQQFNQVRQDPVLRELSFPSSYMTDTEVFEHVYRALRQTLAFTDDPVCTVQAIVWTRNWFDALCKYGWKFRLDVQILDAVLDEFLLKAMTELDRRGVKLEEELMKQNGG